MKKSLLLLIIGLFGCLNMDGQSATHVHTIDAPMKNDSHSQLVNQLAGTDLADLAGSFAHSDLANALLDEGRQTGALSAIAGDPTVAFHPRFAAALVLYFRVEEWPNLVPQESINYLFTEGLRRQATESDEHWGWLWPPGDPFGTLGPVITLGGESAIPHLRPLLYDHTPRSSYFGSEEATEMAMRQYRTKDFAAYYIAQIKGYTLPFFAELPERDQAIQQMVDSLGL